MSDERVFYRVANNETGQGLWYDRAGDFTGLIHGEFSFCANSGLKMPHDPAIVGYLSATDSLDDLYNWFPREDLTRLAEHGYHVVAYKARDYRQHNGHWIICERSSVLLAPVFVVKNEDDHLCGATADPIALTALVNKLSDSGEYGHWTVEAWLDDSRRGWLYVNGLLTSADVKRWVARLTPP
jgi:hypothetical protein